MNAQHRLMPLSGYSSSPNKITGNRLQSHRALRPKQTKKNSLDYDRSQALTRSQ